MNPSLRPKIFQLIVLAVIFIIPYVMFNMYLVQVGLTMSIMPLFLFIALAIIASEAIRRIIPGKEDYVLIPLLLLALVPFNLSVFAIVAFVIMGAAAYLLLKKQ